jgi:ABC-type nitrate/sulfonate/bicarbonate transport system substrate-binding protein
MRRLALLAVALLLSGCSLLPSLSPTPTAPALRTVRFMAGYKPQANLPFVGAYVAQINGYFAAEGLNAEITHATGQGEHLKLLLQGSVDVITASADELLARRAEGVPVVAIAVLGQREQRAYAVRAESEIRSPRDWAGKLVGYKVEPAPDYLALLAAAGVDRATIHEVPVGFDPRLLAAGKVDVYPVFESNEPDTLQRMHVPVRLFRSADYGVPGLGLTYETREQLVGQDADLLARFLKATLKGIEFAREHPDEATDIVMRFAPNEQREHQQAMLLTELEMANGPATATQGIGWATHDQWQTYHDSLLAFGGLKSSVNIDQAFRDDILQMIYRDGRLVWP